MTDGLDPYVVDLVRRHDRGRFVATLFAPAPARGRLLAILAFDLELARIPGSVSEPMLGQMRFQWWRDLVGTVADGGQAPQGHPVAQALAAAMPGLRSADLDALATAHELALTDVDASVEPVAAAVSAVCLQALGVDEPATARAARDAAIGYGLAARPRSADQTHHVLAHVQAARAIPIIDRRAIPVLLWATLAENLLHSPTRRVPVVSLAWRAWRGRY